MGNRIDKDTSISGNEVKGSVEVQKNKWKQKWRKWNKSEGSKNKSEGSENGSNNSSSFKNIEEEKKSETKEADLLGDSFMVFEEEEESVEEENMLSLLSSYSAGQGGWGTPRVKSKKSSREVNLQLNYFFGCLTLSPRIVWPSSPLYYRVSCEFWAQICYSEDMY